MTVFWRDVGWCHQANKGGRGFARSRGVAADRKISSPSHPVIRISIVAARQEDLHTLLDCSSPESPSPSFSTATPLPPRHYRVRSAVFASLALHGLAQPPAPHRHLACPWAGGARRRWTAVDWESQPAAWRAAAGGLAEPQSTMPVPVRAGTATRGGGRWGRGGADWRGDDHAGAAAGSRGRVAAGEGPALEPRGSAGGAAVATRYLLAPGKVEVEGCGRAIVAWGRDGERLGQTFRGLCEVGQICG